MDAVLFFKEKERMCISMANGKCILNNCKLFGYCSEDAKIEEQVALVEQWSKENPIKTYEDVLLEKFPNAKIENLYVPNIFGNDHIHKYWIDEYKN